MGGGHGNLAAVARGVRLLMYRSYLVSLRWVLLAVYLIPSSQQEYDSFEVKVNFLPAHTYLWLVWQSAALQSGGQRPSRQRRRPLQDADQRKYM